MKSVPGPHVSPKIQAILEDDETRIASAEAAIAALGVPALITKPNLTIGTSAASAIKHGAFDFIVGGVQYTKAAGEEAFAGTEAELANASGSTLYMAFRLDIVAALTVSIAEATANGAGYASAALALAGLSALAENSVSLGTLTLGVTTGTTFTPGTTLLSAAGITDVYDDAVTVFEALAAALA
jgi:hypothetical protein